MAEAINILDKASGYGVLLGVGGLFAGGMILTTKLLSKYLNENKNSTEMFMVANRSVNIGLMTTSIYSSWTWATEFLFVSTMVYTYGLQSSYFYSAGLCIQMSVMNLVGIESKRRIPTAHTSLEIVELRYGKTAHLVFLFLCLVTNLLSCASMILGAAGAISIIAGNLNIVASTLLIPFGVLVYTSFGGLKATFLTDFVHTLVLLIVLCYINTSVLTSPDIGGLDGLYDLLLEHSKDRYIDGNYEGSILTSKSAGGIIFGIILTTGNFGLTVMDSSFWQKSFSASVKASCPAYLLAATAIFSNAWGIGSITAAAGIVLEKTKVFPTYPRQMTDTEVDSGFLLPYTVKAVVGNGGVGALLLIIYLAVTSTVSAQMISVSSIVSFDIYKKYINPGAQNKHMIRVSHFGVIFFGLFAAGFSLMLHYVGCNMTWMGYFISMIICPGVIPLVNSILWDRQTRLAAILSPIIGMLAGLGIWVGTAVHYYGKANMTTLGEQLPCLYGSLTALFLPGVLSVLISLTIKPYKYDWSEFRRSQLIVDEPGEPDQNSEPSSDKKDDFSTQINETSDLASTEEISEREKDQKLLLKYRNIAIGGVIFVTLITWVIWPLSLYRDYIWLRAYYKGYATMSLVWLYATLLTVGIYPLYEGRHAMAAVFGGLRRDYFGGRKKEGEGK